jgi:uncharacterized protein
MNNDIVVAKLAELEVLLSAIDDIAVAVSGGVDSLTLARVAHRCAGRRAQMFHAVSPAVPKEATARVEAAAAQFGWDLLVVDAGEFERTEYVDNPVNRCFYCKTSLYSVIKRGTAAQVVSGTNLDDLDEYRPGLAAAAEYAVRHPFVEAGINKQLVRQVARHLGLGEIAELPAAPCLSSRIETGIAIDPRTLALVHASEQLVGRAVETKTVRCRVRGEGIVIELDSMSLSSLAPNKADFLVAEIGGMFADAGFAYSVRFAPYRVGSAFLTKRDEHS